MQRTIWVTASSASAVLLALAGLASADVVETREIEETVPVTAGQPLVVIVKNITGSVRVTGHDSDRDRDARHRDRARRPASGHRARARRARPSNRERARPRRVSRPPPRHERRSHRGRRLRLPQRRWDEDYNVEYDIELRVPRGATLDLATVTDGDVTVEGVSGDFTVANVNGGVRLDGPRRQRQRSTPSTATSKPRSSALPRSDLVPNRQRQARRDVPRESLGRSRVRDDAGRRLHRFRSRVAERRRRPSTATTTAGGS